MEKVRSFVTALRENFQGFETEKIINDLESCVEEFGVKVYYSDMSSFKRPGDISGYSRVNSSGLPEIVVNGNQPEERRRFTIAHELGHIIMHWRWLNQPDQKLNQNLEEILFRKKEYEKSESLRERQANEFAAELLAPLDLVKSQLADYAGRNELEKIFIKSRLAHTFKISNEFANIQIDKAARRD